jgi:predicted O-methyltransferase YrrM
MTFDDVHGIVAPFALSSEEKLSELYQFVLASRPREILDIGCYRGGSALVMAAALDELGRGRVTTYDRVSAGSLSPNVHDLLTRTGLGVFVATSFSEWCCEWELADRTAKCIRDGRYEPDVDFVFVDAGHYWTSAGFTFYLVNNLLRPGGWISFDDLDWTLTDCVADDVPWRARFPAAVRDRPMVRMVFDLLVRPHREFHNFRTTCGGSLGWAQKRASI